MAICAICDRIIIPGMESKHHLIPKSKGGAYQDYVFVHEICHKQIHALFDEKQLATCYNTVAKLKEHKDVTRFILWVSTKPLSFNKSIRVRRKNR